MVNVSSLKHDFRCTILGICLLLSYVGSVQGIDLNDYITEQDKVLPEGTYTLEGDVSFSDPFDGIIIDSQVTLSSPQNNPVIIDCRNLGRAFRVVRGGILTLDHLIIKNGKAEQGGAIFCEEGTVVLNNCYFISNHAETMDSQTVDGMVGGGSVLIYKSQNLGSEIKNCVFTGSHSTYWGGAVYTVASDVNIINSQFYGCSSTLGGAIAAYKGTQIELTGCTFSGNQADSKGGAVYAENVEKTKLLGAGITENTAANGGGLYFFSDSDANETEVYHCTLTNNLCRDTGGAIVNEGTKLKIRNSIIWSNYAENQASEIANLRGSLDLGHSLMICDEQTYINLNPDDEIPDDLIEEDPEFLGSRTIALSSQSPCIDQATDQDDDDSRSPAKDGDGDGIISYDLGAYEYPDVRTDETFPLVVYPRVVRLVLNKDNEADPQVIAVQSSTGRQIRWQASLLDGIADHERLVHWYPDKGKCSSRAEYVTLLDNVLKDNPARSLIDYNLLRIVSVNQEESFESFVLVETIKGEIHVLNKDDPNLSLEDQLRNVLHDVNDGDTINLPANQDVNLTEPIVVSGKDVKIMGNGCTLKCENEAGLVLKHTGPSTVIEGFKFEGGKPAMAILGGTPTVRNCNFADNDQAIVAINSCLKVQTSDFSRSDADLNEYPPSVYISGSRAELVGCTFKNLKSYKAGAAIMADAKLTLRSCEFKNNTANGTSSGGALSLRRAGRIYDCTFEGNHASYRGGAIESVTGQSLDVVGCKFVKNSSTEGGAISFLAGAGKLYNCEFYLNTATDGGAIFCENSNPVITNGVFLGNDVSKPSNVTPPARGGAVYVCGKSQPKFLNCTIVKNNASGIYSDSDGRVILTNCIWGDDSFGPEQVNATALDNFVISYSCVAYIDHYSFASNPNEPFSFNMDPQFQYLPAPVNENNLAAVDLRIRRTSPCIDRGYGLTNVYSDVRGSLRPIDGDGQVAYIDRTPGIYNDFDIGAYEYSANYAGGATEDDVVHANTDIEISPIAVVGQKTEIQWANHAAFPAQDQRVSQAKAYEIDITLVEKDEEGNVIREVVVERNLDISHLVPADGYYTYEVNYQLNHAGIWFVRIGMSNDPTQFWESDKPCRIEQRVPQVYTVGEMITAPLKADKNVKPEFDKEDEPFLFWSEYMQELYVVGPISTLVTWTDTKGEPMPILISVDWPEDPQFHVANTPPVELLEMGDYPYVEVRYAENDANLIEDSAFAASQHGHATLLFCESADYESEPFFEVVRTILWDDPNYLTTCTCFVGEEILDPLLEEVQENNLSYSREDAIIKPIQDVKEKHEDECGSGYIFFEHAPYDATTMVYDRNVRTGQIFTVNQSIIELKDIDSPDDVDRYTSLVSHQGRPYDQLVVAWYQKDKNKELGAQWPFKAVRYLPEWPTPEASDICYRIVIAGEKGSDTDEDAPEYFETQMRNVEVYNQPDRSKPGFNPNEEHAFRSPAMGASDRDAIYALRADLNRAHLFENQDYNRFYTSRPYVLVRYQGKPISEKEGEPWKWHYNVYKVSVEESGMELDYTKFVEKTLIPPNPIDQLLPYSKKSDVEPEPTGPDVTSWYIDNNGDKSDGADHLRGPFFFYKGAIYNRCEGKGWTRWFYPLQEGFWYDLDQDGENDAVVGTDIPWLSQYNPNEEWLDYYDGPNDQEKQPYQVTYNIEWPDMDKIPELQANQTLMEPTEDDSRNNLPEIANQAVVWIIHDTYEHQTFKEKPTKQRGTPCVRLMDFLQEHTIDINDTNTNLTGANYQKIKEKLEEKGITLDKQGKYIKNLPFHLRTRVFLRRNPDQLVFTGYYQEMATGEPIILPNVMSHREYRQLMAPDKSSDESYLDIDTKDEDDQDGFTFEPEEGFGKLVTKLKEETRKKLNDEPARYAIGGSTKALLGMHFQDSNDHLVTLAFNADPDPNSTLSLPVSLKVLKVNPQKLWVGKVHRIPGDNVFDERSTLRHSCLFGGEPNNWRFKWERWYDGYIPNPNPNQYEKKEDNEPQDWEWKFYTGGDPNTNPRIGRELDELTISGSSPAILEDAIYRCQYWLASDSHIRSNPTEGTLNEGWIKRVMRALNPFDQRVKDFRESPIHTLVSMIAQLGDRYKGPVALNDEPGYLNSVGLIELYTTLLDHAKSFISSDATTKEVNQALLFATSRIADFYMLLGHEAYTDALDPTIGFSTDTADYSVIAPSLFCFQDFMPTLLDEELALLRGQDSPIEEPIENRLPWNFTLDMGEVAYVSNYGISDQNGDGFIDELDAKIMYPQAHGDAWGHYLMTQKTYYDLLKSSFFTWEAAAENLVLGGTHIKVDYHDESKFSVAAAARARVGVDIIDLTFRQNYAQNSNEYLAGFPDPSPRNKDDDLNKNRHWGVFDWACRAGQGAYFDWVVGNALLYTKEMTGEHGVGMMDYIDRTTVAELPQVTTCFADIQAQVDKADIGLNPLGLSKASLSFDINPNELVDAHGQAAGRTHFEQVYDRAAASLNNALIAFNYANRNTQNLRRQQDTLDGFIDSVEDREADFNSRLIEIYGTPYPEDIGATGTYPLEYNGPDIYHYDYVDTSALMQGSPVGTTVTIEVDLIEVDVTETGELIKVPRKVEFEFSKQGFGLIKPESWQGQRAAPGELQIIRSDLIQAKARFQQLLQDYDNLILQMEDQVELLQMQYNVNAQEIHILNRTLNEQISLNRLIRASKEKQLTFRSIGRAAILVSDALAEAFPQTIGFIVGFSNGAQADVTAPARSAAQMAGALINEVMSAAADWETLNEMDIQQAKEIVQARSNIEITTLKSNLAIEQQLKSLEQLVRTEASKRWEIYIAVESIRQISQRYCSTLQRGERLRDDLLRFRQQTANKVQTYRYKDMAFRVLRNEAVQKYRAQFDMAAKYVYLAALAYDYETSLIGNDPLSCDRLLQRIISARTIGYMEQGVPLPGNGLAGVMAELKQNFDVLRSQLGFNNPQIETTYFSIRRECLRIDPGAEEDALWQDALERYYVDNLWNIPEFRRFCKPFSDEWTTEPALVIPFETTIANRRNFFNLPLGADAYYAPENFATKIRSIGVWFSNYDTTLLSPTPRIYLIPVGQDRQRCPVGDIDEDIRSWRVLEQCIPEPFRLSEYDLTVDNWIPGVDSVPDTFAGMRRFNRFRAYPDGGFNPAEMTYDSRLVGRSAWNTKWFLIIPGSSLFGDPQLGLDRFMYGPAIPGSNGERVFRGITDIKLFFKTYAYTGY